MIRIVTRKQLREEWKPGEVGLGAISEELRNLLLANPAAGGDDEPVQILSEKDGQVLGKLNLFAGRIRAGSEEVQIQWGSGFLVPPEHRSSGAGLAILFRTQGLPYALGSIGASQQAVPVYRKLNWVDLVAPRYVLPRRARPLVERYVSSRALRGVACALGDAVIRTYGLWAKACIGWQSRGFRIEQVDAMPEEWDAWLTREQDRAACVRSARWVNWILHTPGGRYRKLFLVKDRAGKPLGYFVINHRIGAEGGGGKWKDFVIGSVKDWMTFDRDLITDEQLVGLAIRELMRRQAVEVIDVCAADGETGRAARSWGMRRMGGMHFMFRARPKSVLDQERYRQLESWRIRPADGDYFIF